MDNIDTNLPDSDDPTLQELKEQITWVTEIIPHLRFEPWPSRFPEAKDKTSSEVSNVKIAYSILNKDLAASSILQIATIAQVSTARNAAAIVVHSSLTLINFLKAQYPQHTIEKYELLDVRKQQGIINTLKIIPGELQLHSQHLVSSINVVENKEQETYLKATFLSIPSYLTKAMYVSSKEQLQTELLTKWPRN